MEDAACLFAFASAIWVPRPSPLSSCSSVCTLSLIPLQVLLARASGSQPSRSARPRAYEIGSGLVVLALLWAGQRRALGAALLAFAFIPTCDAAIVLLNGGPPAIAIGIHATTACLLLVLAALLLWQPTRQAAVGANRSVAPTI